MPSYSAIDLESGQHTLVVLPMSQAPEIGTVFQYEGRDYRRLPDIPGVPIIESVAHVAHSLPTGFDEHNQPLTKGAGAYLQDGTPVITSQRDIDEIQRQNPGWKHGANKHRLNLDK